MAAHRVAMVTFHSCWQLPTKRLDNHYPHSSIVDEFNGGWWFVINKGGGGKGSGV